MGNINPYYQVDDHPYHKQNTGSRSTPKKQKQKKHFCHLFPGPFQDARSVVG